MELPLQLKLWNKNTWCRNLYHHLQSEAKSYPGRYSIEFIDIVPGPLHKELVAYPGFLKLRKGK